MVQHKQAFTLIELLVVVLIIGILAAVAVPQYKKAVVKAQLTKAMVIYDAYRKAIDVWKLGNDASFEKDMYFTGDGTNTTILSTSLDIGMVPDSRTATGSDIFGGMRLVVFCSAKSKNCTMQLYGWSEDGNRKWLNGCGVGFQQFNSHNEASWRYTGIRKDSHAVSATVPAECIDAAKIMCTYWKDTKLFNTAAKAQCDSLGIIVEKAPYPDEL